jgi:hypothetical protein
MPIEKVPNTSLNYYLIAFDKDGNERDEADGKKLSEQIFSALANEPIIDVFLMSHGWMSDVPRDSSTTTGLAQWLNKQPILKKSKRCDRDFVP